MDMEIVLVLEKRVFTNLLNETELVGKFSTFSKNRYLMNF